MSSTPFPPPQLRVYCAAVFNQKICNLICRYCRTVPYHTILYHPVRYHIVPYHTIQHHNILYHFIPYHTKPYHTITYKTIAYYTVPSCTIPYQYRTAPYHTIPYHHYSEYKTNKHQFEQPTALKTAFDFFPPVLRILKAKGAGDHHYKQT